MYKFFSIYSIENVMESLLVSLSIFIQKKKRNARVLIRHSWFRVRPFENAIIL